MLVTASQMKSAEESAFQAGFTPAGLMEIAGRGIARSIRQFFPTPGTLLVYCGKGNNGGDALVAARNLMPEGWRVFIRCSARDSELPPLVRGHLLSLDGAEVVQEISETKGDLLLLDGLLGIGGSGTPRGVVADLITEMNQLRSERGGYTIAVDLPSGLDATTGAVSGLCVQADMTVTIGAVKSGLVGDSATGVVGRLALVPLPGVSFPENDPACIATSEVLRHHLPVRDFNSFKGTYGRIGILAGSHGYFGAARLCSAAAVHAGGGLVTLYATPGCYGFLTATCIPEVMVKPLSSYREVLGERNNVLALGPGLGREHDEELRLIVEKSEIPCVVDADALNAVSSDIPILSRCAGPRLLTPHPGEMERLSSPSGRSRRAWAEELTEKYPVTLFLKGARTVITQRNQPTAFNTTGNPGMGSGGMGDVLTGVLAALIGGAHSPRDAAMLGAWICGRAAEIAIFKGGDSQESLSASSVIDHLGAACNSLRKGEF